MVTISIVPAHCMRRWFNRVLHFRPQGGIYRTTATTIYWPSLPHAATLYISLRNHCPCIYFRELFSEVWVFFVLKEKTRFLQFFFLRGPAAKLIGTNSGGMLYYFRSLLIKRTPPPSPPQAPNLLSGVVCHLFRVLWYRLYCCGITAIFITC